MKLFTIQKRGIPNNMLGIHYTHRSYVVAFRSRHVAEHVANHLHRMPRLVLNTDTNHLTIYKSTRAIVNCNTINPFVITEYMFDDLVLHPFQNCLGLVLPIEIIKDDPMHFVFQSNIIQPCSEDVCAMIKYGVRSGPDTRLDA